jgi:hypothetical protein
VHGVDLAAEHANVAARIDACRDRACVAQRIDRAVDCVAFGDAAEIQQQRPGEAYAALVEVDVAPARAPVVRRVLWQKAQIAHQASDRRIEGAARALRHVEGAGEHRAECPGDRLRAAVRQPVDTRKLAGRILSRQRAMHLRDRRECVFDASTDGRGRSGRSDIDHRPEEKAGGAPEHLRLSHGRARDRRAAAVDAHPRSHDGRKAWHPRYS